MRSRANYLAQVKNYQTEFTYKNCQNFEEMKAYFTSKEADKIEGGFILGKWCGSLESEKLLEELKVTIRCLPLEQSGTEGNCLITGKKATLDAIFAKSY